MVKTPAKPTQKNLFSFFSQKPKPTAPQKSTAEKAAETSAKAEEAAKLPVGTRLSVYWPADDEYYPCVIQERKPDGRVRLFYDDGEEETIHLGKEEWKRLDAGKREGDEEGVKESGGGKRRRILESDEEFDMDEESEGGDDDDDDSFKIGKPDDDDEPLDVDEEEEEEEETPKPKRAAKTSPKVTKTSPKVTLVNTTNKGRGKVPSVSLTPNTRKPNPPSAPSNLGSVTKQLNPTPEAPAKPIPGAINHPGTHLHNHLKFFTTERKDAAGRPATHPDHSTFTLQVDYAELENTYKAMGKTLSPGHRQWWEIKSSHANCVLLFKTGKFYEMHHDDADVAVSVLGHSYMKGADAHAGFPEHSYDKFIGILVERGYRVARVEQTETPAGLAERKKKTKGKKPQVVAREVCGVVTMGTRTFCYLDDASCLEKDSRSSKGPLIAIKEIPINKEGKSMEVDDDDVEVSAVCEYGVTIVNAVTASVTLGQFADDVLRSRMQTLLASFSPSEVIIEGGENGASKTLQSLLKTACPTTLVQTLGRKECFPNSTAVELKDREFLNRTNKEIHPWSSEEAIKEVHRKGYFPRAGKENEDIGRWPEVLRACIEGGAELAMSSFGAALWYLQCSLIDAEILSMGIVKAYIPPKSGSSSSATVSSANTTPAQLQDMYDKEASRAGGIDLMDAHVAAAIAQEENIDSMVLDGTTIHTLEILHNLSSGSSQGSLLSKIDFTNSPHGSRLLRAWVLRPLFRKAEIDRRADAVAELSSGAAAVAMADARKALKKTGDIERLLSRVHSMGGGGRGEGGNSHHPNDRAIYYENEKHNRRKVGDFSKLLNGLQAASDIPEHFMNVSIESPLLANLVRTTDDGGFMPSDLKQKLDWFFENFDLKKAARGEFEPSPGMSEEYDNACQEIENIKQELERYKIEMCGFMKQGTKSTWKYINTKEDAKDKYLIELPASVNVPSELKVKGKRGKGNNQVNKYWCSDVDRLAQDMERAIDIKNEAKSLGMKMVFAKFAALSATWNAAVHASAMLDALGSLAELASQPGYCRPIIADCPENESPSIKVVQGRHPCVDITHNGGSFIPNDLKLGGNLGDMDEDMETHNEASVLLLSGPNMGGKSTLLRQTCLITILAQVGSFVPAEECTLTPVDRIFTRLGASDRILCGQSTFFVELAETAAAVRGATRRSLVIMDELGRGTSTFDGTAIASATVKHLVERIQCLCLFATHYHSLLEVWKDNRSVRLGHMECIVEEDDSQDDAKSNITFLYTLGDGPCPRSFGVNVAKLAGLPDDVLRRAKNISAAFEAEMRGESNCHKIIPSTAKSMVANVKNLYSGDCLTSLDQMKDLWKSLQ